MHLLLHPRLLHFYQVHQCHLLWVIRLELLHPLNHYHRGNNPPLNSNQPQVTQAIKLHPQITLEHLRHHHQVTLLELRKDHRQALIDLLLLPLITLVQQEGLFHPKVLIDLQEDPLLHTQVTLALKLPPQTTPDLLLHPPVTLDLQLHQQVTLDLHEVLLLHPRVILGLLPYWQHLPHLLLLNTQHLICCNSNHKTYLEQLHSLECNNKQQIFKGNNRNGVLIISINNIMMVVINSKVEDNLIIKEEGIMNPLDKIILNKEEQVLLVVFSGTPSKEVVKV